MLMIGITMSRSWRWPPWSAALSLLILFSNLPLNKWSQYDRLLTKTQSASLRRGFIILFFTTDAWDSRSFQSLTGYCHCWTGLAWYRPNEMEDNRKTATELGAAGDFTMPTLCLGCWQQYQNILVQSLQNIKTSFCKTQKNATKYAVFVNASPSEAVL